MMNESQRATHENNSDLIIECFRLLKAEQGNTISVNDLAKKLGKEGDDSFATCIHLAVSDLIWKGLAVIDHSICRNYRLSETGTRLSVDDIGPGIIESSAFLSTCRDATEWDEVLDFYFSQAVLACERQVYSASQFLLGAACERTIICLASSLVGTFSIKDKKKTEDPRTYVSERTRITKEAIKRLVKQNQGDERLINLEGMLDCLAGIYRIGRNEHGHPSRKPDVDPVQLRAYLHAFPGFARTINHAINVNNDTELCKT